MREFMKANEELDMKQEMTEESLDMALEGDEDEEEEERIVGQVLDEIGIQFGETVPDAPDKAPQVSVPSTGQTDTAPSKVAVGATTGGGGVDDSDVDDLQARLNNLKK